MLYFNRKAALFALIVTLIVGVPIILLMWTSSQRPAENARYGFAPSGAPWAKVRISSARPAFANFVDNASGTTTMQMMPSEFLLDPCGHRIENGEEGVEFWFRNPSGTYWGCDDVTRNGMDAEMFTEEADGSWRALNGRLVAHAYSCGGVRAMHRFIPALDFGRVCPEK